MPTLTKQEAGQWREEFLQSHYSEFSDEDIRLIRRWRSHTVKTDLLPALVRQLWNRELSGRVKQRIDEFFNSRLQAISVPAPRASELTPKKNEQGVSDGSDSGDEDSETIKEEDSLGSDENIYYHDQIITARDTGSFFAVGELLARSLAGANALLQPVIIPRIVVAWASTLGPLFEPRTVKEIIERFDSYSETAFATSLVNTLYRLRQESIQWPAGIGDLAYKLREEIARIYDVDDRRSPLDTCTAALAALEFKLSEFEIRRSEVPTYNACHRKGRID